MTNKIIIALIKTAIWIIIGFLIGGVIHGSEQHFIQLEPSFKIGKIENGPTFMELKVLDFVYTHSPKFEMSGNLLTGFVSERGELMKLEHSINQLRIKLTYRPMGDVVGLFYEGNYADTIQGSTPASYFCYQTYQAVGVSIKLDDMFQRKIKGEK